MARNYTKQPITITDQVNILKKRGLIIPEDSLAEDQLRKISYFRLASYWRPMEKDKVNHIFKTGSTFENALQLYLFDRELRNIVFTAIQTVEIALRSKIIQHVSLKYGSFWFADASIFANYSIYVKCFANLKEEMSRSKEEFLAEHFSKYDTPPYPPAWKALEVASFGTIAKLYANLKDVKLKKQIAREFGLPQHLFLESWIKSIAALRNCVAHHARVWNRKYPIKPQLPVSLSGHWVSTKSLAPERLYAILCTLQYLLTSLGEGESFKQNLIDTIKKYPMVDTFSMGFLVNWQNEPLWR